MSPENISRNSNWRKRNRAFKESKKILDKSTNFYAFALLGLVLQFLTFFMLFWLIG
jgi:hypothetical protein